MSLYLKMVKKRKVCTVFYASETGTAKKFAKEASELFNMSYKTELIRLDTTSAKIRASIAQSDIQLVIVSTFGNGESPEMARSYVASINQTVENVQNKVPATLKALEYARNAQFAVFGLGSSAYPKFAAFGKHLDTAYEILGANRMVPFTAGDELKDQKGSFKKWLRKTFIASLNIMKLEAPKAFLERINSIKQFRWKLAGKDKSKNSSEALSQFYDIPVNNFVLTKRTNLHNESKEPGTLKLDFTGENEDDLSYDPGDHLSIFPKNDVKKVEFLKSRLNNNPPSNRLCTLQVESAGLWESAEDYPEEITYDDMLTYFLDINQIPPQSLLGLFGKYAEDKDDKEALTLLAADDVTYENWRKDAKVIRRFKMNHSIKSSIPGCCRDLGRVSLHQHQLRYPGESAGNNQTKEVQHCLGSDRG